MPSPVGHMLAAFAAGYGTLLLADRLAWRTQRRPPGGRDDRGDEASTGPDTTSAVRTEPWSWSAPGGSCIPAMALAVVGVLPDLDLLVGGHSGWTHSLGAAGLAACAAAAVGRGRRGSLAAAVFAAYASHVLLDWVGEDGAAPIGIMALWPFSGEYWHAPVDLFLATERRHWLPGFWTHNARALLLELLWLGPPAAFVFMRLPGVVGGASGARSRGRSPESTRPPLRRARRKAGS